MSWLTLLLVFLLSSLFHCSYLCMYIFFALVRVVLCMYVVWQKVLSRFFKHFVLFIIVIFIITVIISLEEIVPWLLLMGNCCFAFECYYVGTKEFDVKFVSYICKHSCHDKIWSHIVLVALSSNITLCIFYCLYVLLLHC